MSTLRLKSHAVAFPAFLLGFLASGRAYAGWGDVLNLPTGVTPISREVYDLHMLIFWICVLIGIGVFGVMLYSIIRFRKSRGATAAHFHENTTVEVIWTVIPFLILVGMAVPSTATLVTMEDTSDADLRIQVTGYQWKWHYDYREHPVSFFSNLATPMAQIHGQEKKGEHYLREVDNRLVVPTNRKIEFLITAKDVVHAWWVPKLGTKKDAIPGFVNEMWAKIEEPGVYRGQCAELCGRGHAYMPIVVEAKPPDEFQRWLTSQQSAQQAEKSAKATQNE